MTGIRGRLDNVPFRTKLILSFIVACLVPLGIASVTNLNGATNAIHLLVFNHLESLTAVKKVEVETYFESIRNQIITQSESRMTIDAMRDFAVAFDQLPGDAAIDADALAGMGGAIRRYYDEEFARTYTETTDATADVASLLPSDPRSVIAQYNYIAANANPLGSKDALDVVDDGTRYAEAHSTYHPIYRNFLEKFGYYDIFLVEPENGRIVYSVFKEVDFATSLVDGPYAYTNFARAFREARELPRGDSVALVDFEPYLPSYDAAASFIASPIYGDGELLGVLVFQMPVGKINAIMQERAGLGETGETYLIGDDFKMRSQSRFLEENTIIQSIVDTAAAKAVIRGETGSDVIDDYRGVPVLSSYRPLDIAGLSWGVLAEIDRAEAFEDVTTLASASALTVVFGVLLSVLIAWVLAKSIMRILGAEPNQLHAVVNAIASGDLSMDLGDDDSATGIYANARVMQSNLKARIESDKAELSKNRRVLEALDNVSASVMIADADLRIIYVNEAGRALFTRIESALRRDLGSFKADSLVGDSVDVLFSNATESRNRLNQLTASHREELEVGGVLLELVASPVIGDRGERLGIVLEWSDRTAERAIEREIQAVVERAMRGDLQHRISIDGKQGFYRLMSDRVNELVDVSEQVIGKSVDMFSKLANGDLRARIDGEYDGLYGRLKTDANLTAEKLAEIVAGIQATSATVRTGADEIASGNAHLSSRTEQQASSLEETAASMEEMTATVQQSAENAGNANEMSDAATKQAESGGDVVRAAIAAMEAISESSDRIEAIIGVIDEIAFQTNLLALNASVEAARAGEQGRGFAVVATEVRNLAGRSATAAKEIKELIQDSGAKVEEGSRLVTESGETLLDIVGRIKRVSEIVAEMAAASEEQSAGIGEVNDAVRQMDEMTQQNAALVEEVSAASSSLGSQASELERLVGFFTVDETRGIESAEPIVGTYARADSASLDAANEAREKPAATGTDDDWAEF